MKVLNEYPNSHHYWEDFEKTDLFCPACGKQEVWEEQGAGDYYLGPDFICTACGSDWTMQGPNKREEPNVKGKIEQLRTGTTKTPTTVPGR